MIDPNQYPLPNFFLIGAAKSGTTALYAILKEHPQVFFPVYKKEPRFFSDDERYFKGLEWFSTTFYKGAGKFPARGDATPHYLHWSEKVAPRIQQAFGPERPKILAILREPASRAYSHYWLGVSLHGETLGFEEALAKEEERLRTQHDELQASGRIRWGYFRGGCYATLLKPFFERFPREDILILLQEDLRNDFQATMDKLVSFLGLDPTFPLENKIVNEAHEARSEELQQFFNTNSSPFKNFLRKVLPLQLRYPVRKALYGLNRRTVKYAPISKETEALLRQRYLPEVQELERLTGMSLKNWYPK